MAVLLFVEVSEVVLVKVSIAQVLMQSYGQLNREGLTLLKLFDGLDEQKNLYMVRVITIKRN